MKKILIILSLVLLLSGCIKSSETCLSNEPSTLEVYKNQIETLELKGNKANCELTRFDTLLCRFGQVGKLVVIPTSLEQLEGSCDKGIKYESGRPDIKVIQKNTINGQKIYESIDKDDNSHEGWTWCSKDEKFVIGIEVDNGLIQRYFDKFYRC